MKKINAVLSLIMILLLLLHAGSMSYMYLTMNYIEGLVSFTSGSVIIATFIHSILGMISVFLNADGTRLDMYPKLNRATVIQRISAALILPLVFVHVKTFGLMKEAASSGKMTVVFILMVLEVLLFATVTAHASVSLSRALITLGILKSRELQKKIDRVCWVIGGIVFVTASFAVIRTQLIMFAG